jgi:hypothetical protein
MPVTDFEHKVINALGELKAQHTDLYKALLGNGQPGRVQLMEKNAEETSKRIGSVERKFWYFSGGLSFLLITLRLLFGR